MFMCVLLSLCTTVINNTAQNSLLWQFFLYPLDNRHCSDDMSTWGEAVPLRGTRSQRRDGGYGVWDRERSGLISPMVLGAEWIWLLSQRRRHLPTHAACFTSVSMTTVNVFCEYYQYRSASLDHESGTLYMLLFVRQTRPCASGNSWKGCSLSDDHGAGGVEPVSYTHLTLPTILRV